MWGARQPNFTGEVTTDQSLSSLYIWRIDVIILGRVALSWPYPPSQDFLWPGSWTWCFQSYPFHVCVGFLQLLLEGGLDFTCSWLCSCSFHLSTSPGSPLPLSAVECSSSSFTRSYFIHGHNAVFVWLVFVPAFAWLVCLLCFGCICFLGAGMRVLRWGPSRSWAADAPTSSKGVFLRSS